MTITEMLKIYEKYKGNIDAFAKFSSKSDKNTISEDDWDSIDRLIQEVTQLDNNIVSDRNRIRIQRDLSAHIKDETVLDKIRDLK